MNHAKSTAPHRQGGKTQIVYSTTDGRQRFPDILQVTYGDKAVIGFDRYGRTLGAVVPVEAVLMLAGHSEHVDDDVRARIKRAASALIAELPSEQRMIDEANGSGEFATLDEVAAARTGAPSQDRPRRKRAG